MRERNRAGSGVVVLVAIAASAVMFGLFATAGLAATGSQSGATASQSKGAGQTAADDQYGSTGALKPATKVASATASKPSAGASGGTLPFTGLSLGGLAVLGLALLGVGIALRRRERRE